MVADRLGRSAAEHGYRAYLKLVGGNATLYGVRVGPFRDRRDAKRIARSLESDGFDVQLVDEDPRTASYVMRNASKARKSP
jgi:cell division septation protein DedD